MKLTTKGRYAVTAVIDIAMYSKTSPVSLTELNKRQEISVAYLEQLASKLRATGILLSVRGARGGYKLGRSAEEITIADIIYAIEETVDTRRCQGRNNCKSSGKCLTHGLWEDLNSVISGFLSKVTVASLILENKEFQKREIDIKTNISSVNLVKTEGDEIVQKINFKNIVAIAE